MGLLVFLAVSWAFARLSSQHTWMAISVAPFLGNPRCSQAPSGDLS